MTVKVGLEPVRPEAALDFFRGKALFPPDRRYSHLDVFREEPLPSAHPYWAHPRVTVTPHIASATRPETASLAVAENVRRGLAGEPLLNLVDRERGY